MKITALIALVAILAGCTTPNFRGSGSHQLTAECTAEGLCRCTVNTQTTTGLPSLVAGPNELGQWTCSINQGQGISGLLDPDSRSALLRQLLGLAVLPTN